MVGLVDHLGRPVSTASLKNAEATAHVTQIRSMLSGHPADGLTPGRLAGILRAAERGDALQYLQLAEQMEEKDLHYLSVLGTRKRAISQLPITVKAASDEARDKEIAAFVESWLERDALQAELFDILDAIGKGFSVSRIGWDTSEGQWLPASLTWVDPGWFDIDQLDGRTLYLRGEHGGREDLAPFQFLVHEHQAKSGLPIRGGLARPVAWAWMFKNYALKDWVAFAEVYGLPLRVGKYGPGATPAEIATLMRSVADMGSDAAAVIPQSMTIEFIDAKAQASPDFFIKLINLLDQQISKAVLGQTATTDAIAGGHAVGKEHNDVRGDIERADAQLLATTINTQLIQPIVKLNFGPQKRYPKVQIGREEAVDLKLLAETLERLVPLGLDVEVSVIRDKLGFPEPAKGAPILRAAGGSEGAATQPPPAPASPARLPSPANPSRGASQASQSLSAAASDQPAPPPPTEPEPDAIDRFADQVLGDGDWIIQPMAQDIEALAASCSSMEELRDRLCEALAAMDITNLAGRLGDGQFVTRLTGEAGLNPSDLDA